VAGVIGLVKREDFWRVGRFDLEAGGVGGGFKEGVFGVVM
jgi:hypothetical protein